MRRTIIPILICVAAVTAAYAAPLVAKKGAPEIQPINEPGPASAGQKMALAADGARAIPVVLTATPPAAPFPVSVSQTRQLPISGSAFYVAVGDEEIAGVNVVTSRIVMISGKKTGTTNVLVWDQAGHVLYDGDVAVTAPSGEGVTVIRGAVTTAYVCAPACQPSAPDTAPAQAAANGTSANTAANGTAANGAAAAPAPTAGSSSSTTPPPQAATARTASLIR